MRALTIARYNWPFHLAAGLALIGGVTVSGWSPLPALVRGLALLGGLGAAWFAASSFLASYWVFDRSELTRWRWLAREIDPAPARWVHIHVGLEETNAPLSAIFPGTTGVALDIYDPAAMNDPALTRAREQKGPVPATPARAGALPVPDGWAEAVFLLMTAHELRLAANRETFFGEVARILSPRGQVVVVEHLRDLPNALAFGPGALHFFSRREWRRLGTRAGLAVKSERSFTPFVRVFVYGHTASSVPITG